MEKKIIDVSKHQGTINWAKVKSHVDGVIIRCGYGKDIPKQDDPLFHTNVKGCIENNIPFGVYIYSYAKDDFSAKSEAEHVLRLIESYKDHITYPVYYDLEEKGTESGAAQRAKVFAKTIIEAGFQCGIYANDYWWKNYLKDNLDAYSKWVARYSSNKPTGISGTYDMWQYTDKASVPGVNGSVDMSICYKKF